MTILDEYFTLSDAELLVAIRTLTEAIASPDQSASSIDEGSYKSQPIGEMRRERDRMTRCYAARTGAVLPPKRGITARQVVVRKNYYERGTR